MRSFGCVVRDARLARGMTLQAVAAKVGTYRGYISAIENARVSPPSAGVTVKLARALGLDPRDLLKRGWIEKAPSIIRGEVADSLFPEERAS